MALTERTRLYEALVRVNDDLSIGSSQRNIYELLRDGVVVEARVLPPQPLANLQELAAILGSDALGLLTRNADQAAELADLTSMVANLNQALDTKVTEVTEANTANASLTTQLAEALVEIDRLNALLTATPIDPPQRGTEDSDELQPIANG